MRVQTAAAKATSGERRELAGRQQACDCPAFGHRIESSDLVRDGRSHPFISPQPSNAQPLEGRGALARMNDMHGRLRIANEHMLYVLSNFVFEPIRCLERFGRRPMTEHEMTAWFHYYHGLGRRMGICDLPADRAGLEMINRQVEASRFRYAESNVRIGSVTRDLFLGFYLPKRLFWAGRPVMHAFMDAPLLHAMGFPRPPAWLRRAAMAGMEVRRAIMRLLPPRRKPRRLAEARRPTYPGGYRIEELGTFPGAGHAARPRAQR